MAVRRTAATANRVEPTAHRAATIVRRPVVADTAPLMETTARPVAEAAVEVRMAVVATLAAGITSPGPDFTKQTTRPREIGVVAGKGKAFDPKLEGTRRVV
jgi:hypothetical protein